jgi:hypothetical protein
MKFTRIRLALAWIALVPFTAMTAVEPGKGIAANYRGDLGIDKDNRVLFAENFEASSIEAHRHGVYRAIVRNARRKLDQEMAVSPGWLSTKSGIPPSNFTTIRASCMLCRAW